MVKIISPSILSADFSNLKDICLMINDSDAEWLHVDVMDGVFVPNISFGFPVMDALRKHCRKMLDVHIMIEHPEKYVSRFAKAGAGMLTFHYETTPDPAAVISLIRSEGIKVGITINPDVSVAVLEPYLDQVDMVLIMSVFAGYGGQKFIEETFSKIAELKTMALSKNPSLIIEVDGGVNFDNAHRLFEAGVNVLVAGSTVFNSDNPAESIHRLLHS